jgi:hypothetical protein
LFKSFILTGASLVALTGVALADQPAKPMFMHGVFGGRPQIAATAKPPAALPTWTFDWTYKSKKYHALFVGKKPTTGKSVTIPVYIIPVKLTYKTTTEDPTAAEASGLSPIQYTVDSPIFDATTNYTQGGTNVGTTQYEDAFQRAALWSTVSLKTGYHVLLGKPTIEPEQSFTIPAADGGSGTYFGVKVITADINWFDAQIKPLLTSLKIPANSLPIFVTTQTYLTSGGCCIGGYHSYTGTQAYSMFTFIQTSGAFSQDVSALSHEVGEWVDDPLTNNNSVPASCGTQGNDSLIYEVGDPIEVDANYGDYPYVLNGVTYHLQDLVLPPYFGAPTSTSVNGWYTFQGTNFSVCQNGG